MTRAAIAAAAKAFGEALEEACKNLPDDAPELQNPEAIGKRAALLVVSEIVWRQGLGPLYDAEQVMPILTAKTPAFRM